MSEDNNNKIGIGRPCLICYEDFPSYNIQAQSLIADMLRDRFKVFCKFMGWESNNNYYSSFFNFHQVSFPFCKNCKRFVIQIHELNEQVETCLGQIQQLARTVSAKILLTSTRGISRKDVETLEDVPLRDRMYMRRIGELRREIKNRYLVSVRIVQDPLVMAAGAIALSQNQKTRPGTGELTGTGSEEPSTSTSRTSRTIPDQDELDQEIIPADADPSDLDPSIGSRSKSWKTWKKRRAEGEKKDAEASNVNKRRRKEKKAEKEKVMATEERGGKGDEDEPKVIVKRGRGRPRKNREELVIQQNCPSTASKVLEESFTEIELGNGNGFSGRRLRRESVEAAEDQAVKEKKTEIPSRTEGSHQKEGKRKDSKKNTPVVKKTVLKARPLPMHKKWEETVNKNLAMSQELLEMIRNPRIEEILIEDSDEESPGTSGKDRVGGNKDELGGGQFKTTKNYDTYDLAGGGYSDMDPASEDESQEDFNFKDGDDLDSTLSERETEEPNFTSKETESVAGDSEKSEKCSSQTSTSPARVNPAESAPVFNSEDSRDTSSVETKSGDTGEESIQSDANTEITELVECDIPLKDSVGSVSPEGFRSQDSSSNQASSNGWDPNFRDVDVTTSEIESGSSNDSINQRGQIELQEIGNITPADFMPLPLRLPPIPPKKNQVDCIQAELTCHVSSSEPGSENKSTNPAEIRIDYDLEDISSAESSETESESEMKADPIVNEELGDEEDFCEIIEEISHSSPLKAPAANGLEKGTGSSCHGNGTEAKNEEATELRPSKQIPSQGRNEAKIGEPVQKKKRARRRGGPKKKKNSNKEQGRKCAQCDSRFMSEKSLQNHQRSSCGKSKSRKKSKSKPATKNTLFTPETAGAFQFYHSYPYQISEGRFKCGSCPLTYKGEKFLQHHIRNVHISRNLCICNFCNTKFFKLIPLIRHKCTHRGLNQVKNNSKGKPRVEMVFSRKDPPENGRTVQDETSEGINSEEEQLYQVQVFRQQLLQKSRTEIVENPFEVSLSPSSSHFDSGGITSTEEGCQTKVTTSQPFPELQDVRKDVQSMNMNRGEDAYDHESDPQHFLTLLQIDHEPPSELLNESVEAFMVNSLVEKYYGLEQM